MKMRYLQNLHTPYPKKQKGNNFLTTNNFFSFIHSLIDGQGTVVETVRDSLIAMTKFQKDFSSLLSLLIEPTRLNFDPKK